MRFVLLFCGAVLVSGCAGLNPTLDTARSIWGAPAPNNFVPGFEYLEVSVGRHQTVMALGGRRVEQGATLEQWFSGQGEMLELRDGRIERVLGMTHELRHTRGLAPAWASVAAAAQAHDWQRTRQVMPGYFQRTEQVRSRVLAQPPLAGAWEGSTWVQDEVNTRLLSGQAWHYQERFALKEGRVIYSEQCLAPGLCLRLKPLGVVKP